MEFYLVNERPFQITDPVAINDGDRNGRLMRMSSSISIKPQIMGKGIESRDSNSFCQQLENALIEYNSCWKEMSTAIDFNVSTKIQMFLTLTNPASDEGCIEVRRHINDPRDSVFERFKSLLPDVLFKISIVDFHYGVGNKFSFEANDLKLQNWVAQDGSNQDGCKCEGVQFPGYMWDSWRTGSPFQGFLTLTATLDEDTMSNLHLEGMCRQEISKRTRTLLSEEEYSDFEIVAANGVKVKCYKGFLAVSSDVFQAMLGSRMMEATLNSMDMPDMSEEAVRALLAFIYHWDLKEAFKSCDIALELLRAGHKYAMSDLETVMQDILCAKSNEWFNVDAALKLLLFAKSLNDLNENAIQEKLQNKALTVLKWFGDSTRNNIVESEEFKRLFKETPNAALEISALFLTFVP